MTESLRGDSELVNPITHRDHAATNGCFWTGDSKIAKDGATAKAQLARPLSCSCSGQTELVRESRMQPLILGLFERVLRQVSLNLPKAVDPLGKHAPRYPSTILGLQGRLHFAKKVERTGA